MKLVRGAYHPHEVAHAPNGEAPVWSVKEETDRCYNGCVKMLLGELAGKRKGGGLGILFGTHNWESCDLILKELVNLGLAVGEMDGERIRIGEEVLDKVAMGQLYGSSFSLFGGVMDVD